MRNVPTFAAPARFVASIPGVPEVQARALDRRHRLERQQRAFRGPRRDVLEGLASGPGTIIGPAGPGPA